MRIAIGYGETPQWVDLPAQNVLGVLHPNPVPAGVKGEEAIRQALATPIASPRLRDIVAPGEKIAIITSDNTRPLPSHLLLPPLLEELWAAGVAPEQVVIVFALGIHRSQSGEEQRRLVGEDIFNLVRCVDSDPEDTIHLGTTSRGTPVDITREVATADRRIALGNIEYHYFAGYSGGVKALMPGVSTRSAIQNNHRRMVLPEAAAARIVGNPVREDLDEAHAIFPLDFILNVVLDETKQIVHAVAGDPIAAHRAGCALVDALYSVPIPRQAQIVIASQGGAPKDPNLYQTHKALEIAKYALAPGGIIILVGRCQEGFGEEVFARWMQGAASPQELVDRIQVEFELGGHKAAAIAQIQLKSTIFLVSELPQEVVRGIFMTPFTSVQEALNSALALQGAEASIIVIPYAGATLPVVVEAP
ncbi:MAG: nickel-dependent lactate racemase [Symbiobacteriaceae bacterium]|nr:nickel-dependent lactate racemase [Symbiobacteriaceae bacterium]